MGESYIICLILGSFNYGKIFINSSIYWFDINEKSDINILL